LKKIIGFIISFLIELSPAQCAEKTVELTIDNKVVKFAGAPATALVINGQLPAPTLRFKEGDQVTINVHNKMDEGTALHWHGLLVPWTMDGVEGISQKAIQPGDSYAYKFTIKQSGTYWYHAHSNFQEQQGLYGAIIIDPREPPCHNYDNDFVIVLSDWSNTHPEQIFSNLKKKGDYYSPRFPIQPSLARYIEDYNQASPEELRNLETEYAMMQEMRMSIFDFSDVAYDAFLLNGTTRAAPWTGKVNVGDAVRLRFIGAGGSTIFKVKIPGTSMKIIHIQGHDVEPYTVEDFTISPGETTDVLVRITKDSPYIIYAESGDTLGAAYGVLSTSGTQGLNLEAIKPFPTLKPIMMGNTSAHMNMSMTADQMTMHNMDMKDEASSGHEHKDMGHIGIKTDSSETSGTKYQNLKAAYETNDPDLPAEEIRMDLYGYMGKYIWFINGLMEHETHPIAIQQGKRYRLIFTNSSMMIHPMHLHGHFFILRNGHGAYDPLMHTIEVEPGATVVADFDANTSGQWFFHCHHLFHMMSGMARVFQYSTLPTEPHTSEQAHLIDHPMGHPPHIHQSTILDLGYDPYHNVQKGTFKFMLGWDYYKLQLYSEDAEVKKGKIENADLDIFYWQSISEFWAIKGGMNYFYKPARKAYVQPGIGIEGIMPYFIETNCRAYLHKSSIKLDLQLSRDTQITNNFFIRTSIRPIMATKTVREDYIGSGLNEVEYILRPYLSVHPKWALFTELNHRQNYGTLKKSLRRNNETYRETTLTVGISLLN
jgi:FtsP/CotA-like multicopper oxidase with cupredoxin domain